MEYRSYADLVKAVRGGLFQLPTDIDLIVGVPRSGLLVAGLISLYLNKPLTDLDGLVENRLISSGKTKNITKSCIPHRCKKALIVEDTVCSGSSINAAKERLEQSGFTGRYLTYAVYVAPGMERVVDHYVEVVANPRFFEWNIYHHKEHLPNACCNIDGFVCRNPTAEENDDGERYLRFLKSADPLILPTAKVGVFVTARLEKYRAETEAWLNSHGVVYNELVMLNCTAEERRERNLHALFKASIYKRRHDMVLFIESDARQAEEIMRLSGKPVLCVENGVLYTTEQIIVKTKRARKNRSRWNHFRNKVARISLFRLVYKIIKGKQ